MKTLLLASLLALLAPASALAATAKVVSGTTTTGRGYTTEASIVQFNAPPGERNRLTATATTDFVTLVDPAGIQPLSRCVRPNPADATRVRCDVRTFNRPDVVFNEPFTFLDAKLGDGDDTASIPVLGEEPEEVIGGTHPTVNLDGGAGADQLQSNATSTLEGGPGADTLRGGSRSSSLNGGADSDRLLGGTGDDDFPGGAASDGADEISGGGGLDTADYSARRHRIRADLAGDADDGEAGERDRIHRDVENLTGGRAGDVLTGDRHANVLKGGRGNDRISGRGGRDELSGGSGRDKLRAKDAFADLVLCGRGRDSALLDGLDLPSGCERVRRSSAARAIVDPRGYEYQDGRSFVVTVACPRDAKQTCRGSASIRRRGTLGSRRFKIRRGHSRDVTIRLHGAGVGGHEVRATLFLRTRRGRTTFIAHYSVTVGVSA